MPGRGSIKRIALAAALVAAVGATALLVAPGGSAAPAITPPPAGAGFDYQIGGDYPLPAGRHRGHPRLVLGQGRGRSHLLHLLRQRLPDAGERARHQPARRAGQLAEEADPEQARRRPALGRRVPRRRQHQEEAPQGRPMGAADDRGLRRRRLRGGRVRQPRFLDPLQRHAAEEEGAVRQARGARLREDADEALARARSRRRPEERRRGHAQRRRRRSASTSPSPRSAPATASATSTRASTAAA